MVILLLTLKNSWMIKTADWGGQIKLQFKWIHGFWRNIAFIMVQDKVGV